jgi:hypothetical protein
MKPHYTASHISEDSNHPAVKDLRSTYHKERVIFGGNAVADASFNVGRDTVHPFRQKHHYIAQTGSRLLSRPNRIQINQPGIRDTGN